MKFDAADDRLYFLCRACGERVGVARIFPGSSVRLYDCEKIESFLLEHSWCEIEIANEETIFDWFQSQNRERV